MKFVFFGDSLTWGHYGGSFVNEITQRCPQHTIINAGESGNTVINLNRRLETVLAAEPDGIFIMVGGNDAISYSQPETRRYYRRAQQLSEGCVTPEQFEQGYRDLLTTISMNHVLAWVGLPPTEYNPTVVAAFQQYNTIAQNVASQLGIETLDSMPHFLPAHVPDRPELGIRYITEIGQRSSSGWSDYETARQAGAFTFTFDGLHLMPDTALKMADLILPFIGLEKA